MITCNRTCDVTCNRNYWENNYEAAIREQVLGKVYMEEKNNSSNQELGDPV